MKRILSLLAALGLVLSLFAGCGGTTPPSSTPPADGSSTPAESKPEPPKPTTITLGTAGTSGTYYVVGAAMAKAINDNSSFLTVNVQATNGSVENINLVNAGEMEMGFSNADGVFWASTGTGTFQGKEQNLSAVMSLYLSCGQMATMSNSGIKSYADLKGKKVCLGPPSTTIVEMSKAILRSYGIDPEKDITPYYLAFNEGLAELQDGTIDATFFVAAAPTAAMVDATSRGTVSLIDVPMDVLEKVAADNPYFTPYVIPAGTYGGQDKDIHTLKIMTEIFASNDLSEEVVYEFVKQALESIDQYVDAHASCKEINPQTAASTKSRLHPGAERYYKEKGVL